MAGKKRPTATGLSKKLPRTASMNAQDRRVASQVMAMGLAPDGSQSPIGSN